MEAWHQRRHVAAAEAGRRRHAQVPARLDATGADAGFGIGDAHQQALAVLQEGAALVREAQAARGPHQQLDAQSRFQGIDAPPDDRGRHALGPGRGGQAAARGDGDEGFELGQAVHGRIIDRHREGWRA